MQFLVVARDGTDPGAYERRQKSCVKAIYAISAS